MSTIFREATTLVGRATEMCEIRDMFDVDEFKEVLLRAETLVSIFHIPSDLGKIPEDVREK